MDAIRNRILHEKARQAVHEEMIEKRMQREKQKLQEKLERIRNKKLPPLEVRWVSPDEYFEGEWWPPGRLEYTELVEEDFPPCKCTKSHHMTPKEYWTHRRNVNRYRRKKMNERALCILGPETCPWKGTSI